MLITGGARRVGRAVAIAYARAGYDVAITYRNSAADAESLAGEIRTAGSSPLLIQTDLLDLPAAIDRIYNQFTARFDRLDVLINNASVYKPAALADTTLDLIREANTMHIEVPLLLTQRFESLLTTAGGSVINMVDIMAERPYPAYLAYCASKAGLHNLTLGMARQFAPRVRVNGIAPGTVEWAEDATDSQKQTYLKRVPMQRIGSPEEVARLALYLGRDATYQTGQILRIDGGRSIA